MTYQDLKPLIALLEQASLSTDSSEQLATIERGLVAVELGAEEYDFVELMAGIRLLKELDLTGRVWNMGLAIDTNPDKLY